MATAKYKSPHDRALIAFGSDVLAILEDNDPWGEDWNSDTLQQISDSASNFGLSITDNTAHFRIVPRERFRNRLGL